MRSYIDAININPYTESMVVAVMIFSKTMTKTMNRPFTKVEGCAPTTCSVMSGYAIGYFVGF